MTKHTPVPWEINGDLIVTDCYGKVICCVDESMNHPPKRYVSREETKANSRLIAAAPLLAAVCREIAGDSKVDLVDVERRIRLYAALNAAGMMDGDYDNQ